MRTMNSNVLFVYLVALFIFFVVVFNQNKTANTHLWFSHVFSFLFVYFYDENTTVDNTEKHKKHISLFMVCIFHTCFVFWRRVVLFLYVIQINNNNVSRKQQAWGVRMSQPRAVQIPLAPEASGTTTWFSLQLYSARPRNCSRSVPTMARQLPHLQMAAVFQPWIYTCSTLC